jgi:Kdo2-lipid IVA lauroyltransferase/acyltransferase
MRVLLEILATWPLWLLHAVGKTLGWLTYLASPHYRQRVRDNARRGGLNVAQRRASVGQAGCMVAELPRLWFRKATQPIADPVHWHGVEWIETWLGQGRGLVLLTPHLGSFEMAGQALAERFGERWPLTALYRPARYAALRELEETARARAYLATAPANLAGVRQMLRALRQGQMVGLLPDQVPPDGQGVWAPFCGQPAYTMTLAARLVQQTGAAVGVAYCERLAGGRGYRMCVMPLPEPLPDAAAGDLAAAAAINRCMEAVIQRCPTQYLWGYHRYKQPRQQAAAQPPAQPGATP